MQGHLVQRCHQINLALMGDHFSWMKHSQKKNMYTRFLELHQQMGSEIHEEKMKIEDYAESKANVKILVATESEDRKGESSLQMASTKGRLTKPLMKSLKFSIKEPNSIIIIKQLLVKESLTSVLSSSHSMRRQ